ncbi:MAG: sigma 54-interacting transcriptional regulator [Acidobacteriota bacterium]
MHVNCAALPESLIEAELFGVEKGAFTGATATRKGLFELADGGTLFLDEITELPLALQSKLLGVLEDQTIRRLGSEVQRMVAVRVLAATNVDPEKAIADGTFRRALYYRLNVIQIHLPPLREWLDDLPALCRHFIATLAPGRKVDLPDEEIARLAEYAFPGNVRELRNLIERSLILHDGPYIFPSQLISTPSATSSLALTKRPLRLADVERQHILAVFERCGCNLTATAKALDISLSTLRRQLAEYGLRPPSAPSLPSSLEAPLPK